MYSVKLLSNHLDLSEYYIYHLLQHTEILRSANRVNFCVSYDSHNKLRFFLKQQLL
jgi:hypothetical protein